MNKLPLSLVNQIGSFLPSGSEATRAVVLGMDPYDPELIAGFLDLHVDPWGLLSFLRESTRKRREIEGLRAYRLSRLLSHDRGGMQWHVEVVRGERDAVLIEILHVKTREKIAELGYKIRPSIADPTSPFLLDAIDPDGRDVFRDLIIADQFQAQIGFFAPDILDNEVYWSSSGSKELTKD